METQYPPEWNVFPLPKGKKAPPPVGFQKTKFDRSILSNHDGNVGLAAGQASGGVLVFDWDFKRGFGRKDRGFEVIFAEYKKAFPLLWNTKVCRTPNGFHFYYKMVGFDMNNTQRCNGGYSKDLKDFQGFNIFKYGEYLYGFDRRGTGGYAVVPPSIVDGQEYKIINDKPLIEITEEDFNRINEFFLIPKDELWEYKIRPGFLDILKGVIDPNIKKNETGQPEHVYWKELFIECRIRLGLRPEDLYDGLEVNNKGFRRDETIKQINSPSHEDVFIRDKVLTNEKYYEYFPEYKPENKTIESLFLVENILEDEAYYNLYYQLEKAPALYSRGGQEYETKGFKRWKEKYIREQTPQNDDNDEILYRKIADVCRENFEVVCLKESELLMIKEGSYYDFDLTALKGCISAQIIASESKNYRGIKGDVLECLKDSTQMDIEDFYYGDRYIPFLNGYFDVDEFCLKEYDENLKFFYVIPHEYKNNKVYDCPEFIKAIKGWTQHPDSKIRYRDIFEIMGYCMTSETGYKGLFINYGAPDTGKTQFTNIVNHIIGKKNISTITLQQIQGRFGSRFLQFKILNSSADMGKGLIKDSAKLKELTGGDKTVGAEIKGGNNFNFIPTAKFWCNVNDLPELSDTKDDGLFIRVVLIWFPYVNSNIKEGFQRDFYETILMDENEIQGIIHRSLRGMQRLRKRMKFRDIIMYDTRHRWLIVSDNVYAFIYYDCIQDKKGKIEKHEFIQRYQDEYGAIGLRELTGRMDCLGYQSRIFKESIPGKKTRKDVGYYMGLKWKDKIDVDEVVDPLKKMFIKTKETITEEEAIKKYGVPPE